MDDRFGPLDTLAGRFSKSRERAGLTQSALAEPRYTVSYVSQIESGKRTPSPEALAYFAERLQASTSYLQTGVPDGMEDRLAYLVEEGRALLRGGEPARALGLASDVRNEAERYGLTRSGALALVLAADALASLGRTREAIDRYEESLEDGLTEREGGTVVAALAAAYRTVGDLSYAADLIESKLREARVAPLDPGVSADLHAHLLSVYFERGDVTKAERVAERALAAASEGASPSARSNVLWSASRVLAEANRWDEALELAKEARLIVEALDDQFRLARVHSAYAYLCLETDPPRLEDAQRHLMAADALLGKDGPPHERAYVYSERGRLALLTGRAEEALEYGERALENAGDDPLQQAGCRYLRGRALAELGRIPEALEEFSEAAAVFEKTGARQQAASCYREIGEVELDGGDLMQAVEAFRAGLEVLEPRRSRA